MMKKIYAFQACESTCHECTSKDEVNNYKEYIVVEKEELIMKKAMKIKEKIKEKKTFKLTKKI